MAIAELPLGGTTVNCSVGNEFPLVPGGGQGRRELCGGLTYVVIAPKLGPTWGPDRMAMAVLPLVGATVNCSDGKEFALVPGRDPGRRELFGGVTCIGVAPKLCLSWAP